MAASFMLKVGLTGSIAVGKSNVCAILGELGCVVLDADQTARDVVAAGSTGLRQVVEAFGPDVLSARGELDRSRLATIVFSDPEKLAILNSIVHPLVISEQDLWLADREAENPDGIAVIDAALMIESGGYKRFTKLIVVWCEPAIQLARLMLRGNLDRREAEKRIGAQMPQNEKKAFADFLIDTSNGYEDARRQTIEVFERLSQIR